MPFPAFLYEEPMSDSELSFLREKELKERRLFFRTVLTLAVIFIILPCCLGIILESLGPVDDAPEIVVLQQKAEPYAYLYYVAGMLFLLLLLAAASYYSYTRTLLHLHRDIRSGKKTVEKTEISRKQFVNANNTYHFFLHSLTRVSIEVSKEDFDLYEEGDEINIEYSTRSGIYFGYF